MNAEWVTPGPEDVEVVVGSLADENLKRLFFSELQNPNWLAPLTALGAFATDPETWVDEKGLVQARPWPEGQYLMRIAAAEPVAVTDLLVKHAASPNPWVHRVVLDAALALPPAQATRLVPQIVKTLRSGQAWVDAAKVVTLAEAVAIDHPKQTGRLLTGAFEPKAGGDDVSALGTRTRVVSSIDSYWFRELTPRIVPLLAGMGMDGLKSAVYWLMRAMDIPSLSEASSKYDNSHMWRPSIAPSPQNSGLHEISDALVDIVRDTSIEIAQDGHLHEVVDFLEASSHMLFARIAVETTAQVVAASPNPEVVNVARGLLNKEPLLGLDSRPEYVHLALATIPQLRPADVAAWAQMVDAQAWQGSDDVMRRIAAYGQAEPHDVDGQEVAAVRRRMRYRLLLPLDEVLPAGLKTELEEMKTDLGELEHPEFGTYITTSFMGPTSPLDHEALNAMSPDELRTFLSTWEPADDRHFGPSIEGLAHELEVVAETRPELLAAIAGDLPVLGRSYVRAAIAGWTKALSTGYRPTEEVWQLLQSIVELPDSSEDASADLSADDPTWRWAQRGAVDFATSFLTAQGVSLGSRDAAKLWTVVFPLTRHVDPTPQHEIQFGGSNMDPLTLSLNTVRPAAIRAAIKLLRAIANCEGVEFVELRTHILEMLSHHIDAANDPSLAVAAVLGEALGHIWDIHLAWLKEHSEELFAVLDPDDDVRARSDVIVSVALRSYQTGRVFLELMRPVMLDILSGAYAALEHIDGWRGDRPVREAAASHIVTAYVMGLIEDDDPLLTALTSPEVGPDVIGDALGTLGWSIMRARDADTPAEAVPPKVLERAKRLIDGRVAEIRGGRASASELAGFYWWVRADAYPPAWSLPILQLANSDPNFNPKGMLGESLARAAEAEPALTIEVFDGLMPGDGEGWTRYDLLQHAPRIMVAALKSDDPAAQEKAREILDRLGREGHMSVLADVDRLAGG